MDKKSMIKRVLDWFWGYNEPNFPRIAAIWKDIWVIERKIVQLEEQIVKGESIDASREQLVDAKYYLMRLKNELSEYRPEDVERGRKVA